MSDAPDSPDAGALPELVLRRLPRRSVEQFWLLGLAIFMVVAAAATAYVALYGVPKIDISIRQDESRTFSLSSPPQLPEQRLLDVAPVDAIALNAQQSFVANGVIAAEPFVFRGSPVSLSRATDCLAAAAWFEAGDDSLGQRSVIQVVINRALNPAFPSTICGVVFQGAERRTGCQFSFTCDGSMRRTPSATAWQRARGNALAGLSGVVDGSVGYATHYHTDWVVPVWRKSLDKIAQVRTHLFYKWQGQWGRPAAFAPRRRINREEPIVPPMSRFSAAHTGGGEGDTLDLPVNPTVNAPEAGATAQFEPIIVADVPERSLRGAVVRAQGNDKNSFFIQLAQTGLTGTYATAAVALCKGKMSCKVLGWRDAGAIAASTSLSPAQTSALTFVYVRTEPGSDRSLWNCTQVERANRAQCLPQGHDAILRIVQ